jgi:hypothetical protein
MERSRPHFAPFPEGIRGRRLSPAEPGTPSRPPRLPTRRGRPDCKPADRRVTRPAPPPQTPPPTQTSSCAARAHRPGASPAGAFDCNDRRDVGCGGDGASRAPRARSPRAHGGGGQGQPQGQRAQASAGPGRPLDRVRIHPFAAGLSPGPAPPAAARSARAASRRPIPSPAPAARPARAARTAQQYYRDQPTPTLAPDGSVLADAPAPAPAPPPAPAAADGKLQARGAGGALAPAVPNGRVQCTFTVPEYVTRCGCGGAAPAPSLSCPRRL